jgi:YVTN family beta-propeller protein
VLCLLSTLATSPTAPTALADGGAPNLAYIAGAGANGQELAVIGIDPPQEVRHRVIGGSPAAVVLSQDSRYAFVSQRTENQIAVVDARAFTVAHTITVGHEPTALAFDVSQRLLFVANTGSNTISEIDPTTFSVTRTIPVGSQPSGLAIAAANSGIRATNDEEVYVANAGSDTISVISIGQGRVIATIAAPGGPSAVVVPSTGGIAYVATHSGAILALSLSAQRLLGVLWQSPGAQFGAMDYNAVTGAIFVPDTTTDTVVMLTPAVDSGNSPPTFPVEPARSLPFPGGPVAVAITFEGAFGFVAERHAGQVAMFDATTRQTLKVITVGGAPQAIVTGAFPPLLSDQGNFLADALVIVAILLIMGIALMTLIIESRRRARRRTKEQAS